MSDHEHRYGVKVVWTGNTGKGTVNYRAYSRDHVLASGDKPDIAGSSDPAFRGDAARWNPEDLLVASLSACHKLWYLHFCAVSGVVVEAYEDHAEGVMVTDADGAGRFTGVTLKPVVTISAGDPDKALSLHHDAHEKCFIACSVNFPVGCEARVIVQA